MHTRLKTGIIWMIISVSLMLAMVAGAFWYYRYRDNVTKIELLESKVSNLQGTVYGLTSNNDHFLRIGRFNISTTDRTNLTQRSSFRIPYGTNDTQYFDEGVWKATSNIKAIWVSEWSPRTEMMKFEEFKVVPKRGSPWFQIIAKPITNASISMDFEVTVILE